MKKIHLLGLNQKWVPGKEFFFLNKNLKKFGFKTSSSKFAINSIVYLSGKYELKKSYYHFFNNKVVFDYYHGNPEVDNQFKKIFEYILKNKKRFHKIRITNTLIESLFEKYGIKSLTKIIPIGINTIDFKILNKFEKNQIKKKIGIPDNKIIIGSFQKDGVGWDGGNSPKLIKGPDLLISSLKDIYKYKKNIFVLLLGPSRNYVKRNLDILKIPYKHIYEEDYLKIYQYYNLLDLYLITSREEGGPKALLESMSCKIPVISTPVGQCVDIIKNNINGIICENFSPENISKNAIKVLDNSNFAENLTNEGFKTSREHDYNKQKKLWEDFFKF